MTQFTADMVMRPGTPYKLKVVKAPKIGLPTTQHSYIWILEALEAFREPGWIEIGMQYTKSGDMIIAYREK